MKTFRGNHLYLVATSLRTVRGPENHRDIEIKSETGGGDEGEYSKVVLIRSIVNFVFLTGIGLDSNTSLTD